MKLVVLEQLSWLKRFWYVPVIERGQHFRLPVVRSYDLKEVYIHSTTQLAAHLDGELMVTNEFHIKVIQNSYQFRTA